jgi:hypothetical protein
MLGHCTRGCTTKCCSGGDFGPIFREEQAFACLYRHECCICPQYVGGIGFQVRCKGCSPRKVLSCEYDKSKDSNLTITLRYDVHENVSCVQACSSQVTVAVYHAPHPAWITCQMHS